MFAWIDDVGGVFLEVKGVVASEARIFKNDAELLGDFVLFDASEEIKADHSHY